MSSENASMSAVLKAIDNAIEAGTVAALVTLIEGPANVGAKLLIESDGTTGSLGEATLDALAKEKAFAFLASRDDAHAFSGTDFAPNTSAFNNVRLLFERLQPEPHVVICGAGHVGAALARLSSAVGYTTTLIDDRPEFVSRKNFPDETIELIATDSWEDAVRSAVGSGRGICVAIVTRGHNEDEACMRALIGRDPDYIGLIGSKRRTNIVLQRLREAGATREFIDKIRAPIGLDIGAVTPEEVALAILAEIIAVRRGGKGGSLSAWRRA